MLNHEPRTTNHEPRITNHEPRTTNHEPRTTNHEPRTTNHEPHMSLKKPIATMLHKHAEIKIAILFGSMSRGKETADSDLDIAIGADNKLTVDQKEQLIEDLVNLSGRPIDLIDLQQSQEPIFSKALTTGKLIYCTDRNLYAELIKRMLYNQADFVPLRTKALTMRRQAWISK